MRPTQILTASLLCGAATAALAAAPAQAQSADTEPLEAAPATAAEDVIIVTARRREERLVEVPVAVTAISGEELSRRGALDLSLIHI